MAMLEVGTVLGPDPASEVVAAFQGVQRQLVLRKIHYMANLRTHSADVAFEFEEASDGTQVRLDLIGCRVCKIETDAAASMGIVLQFEDVTSWQMENIRYRMSNWEQDVDIDIQCGEAYLSVPAAGSA